jgi:hypothetical protein
VVDWKARKAVDRYTVSNKCVYCMCECEYNFKDMSVCTVVYTRSTTCLTTSDQSESSLHVANHPSNLAQSNPHVQVTFTPRSLQSLSFTHTACCITVQPAVCK